MSDLSLTCTGLADLVTEYLEGALDARRVLSFETHAVICPGCRVFVRQVRETVERLRALPPEPIDARERETVLAAFR